MMWPATTINIASCCYNCGADKKSPFNSYRGESSEHETGRLEVKRYLLTVNSELFTGVNISTVRCLLLQFSQFSLHNASLLNQPVCCRSHIHNALLITVSIQRQMVAKTVITNESINLWKKTKSRWQGSGRMPQPEHSRVHIHTSHT